MIFLDTNAVIWIYQNELNYFSEEGRYAIATEDLAFSPMVKLELEYLNEVKRIKVKADKILKDLYSEIGLFPQNIGISVLIEASLNEKWTRDPFDRLITSHAKAEKSKLLTRDATILENYPLAFY